MADSVNPTNNKTSNLIPRFYRTDANKKFIQATVDQLVTTGTVKKINGFVGRQNAKASTGSDIFLDAPTTDRQRYQLEPGLVIRDELENVTFFKDYQDYINQLRIFGANVDNHSRLNEQEFYSWDPHIDWDKFVNFQNYYWLPYGPDVIAVAGQQQKIDSTYTVKLESELDSYEFVFTPNGLTRNPTLRLFRGQTYTFEINSPANPFSIKTSRTAGGADRYSTIDFNQAAVELGTMTLIVPHDAPDILYYVSEADVDIGGVIHVLDITENTAINVDNEIVGKKTYKLADGTGLSNGMKLKFTGKVTPEKYSGGEFYVEGVGKSIVLIKESDLSLLTTYTSSSTVPFDATPFDKAPFSEATAFSGQKDYILINRASLDRNAWSRYNRWFHQDVVNASAAYNNKVPSLDQLARAVRPIIEFNAGLRLYNFGTKASHDVDLIDTYTTDIFSFIEGKLGYHVDSMPLANGQKILFTADPDPFVKDKIFQVKFVDVLHNSSGSRQIHLELIAEPAVDEVVLVKQGNKNQGSAFWYDGSTWTKTQQKNAINQPPMFDVVNDSGISFGDASVYEGTTFTGTQLFSYKIGSGTVDTNLNFALSYKNINNIGDIVFNFDILSDHFQYKDLANVISKSIDVGFLRSTDPATGISSFSNGWKKSEVAKTQAALRIYKNSNKTNNFDLDIFDDKDNLDDLIVKVYINGKRLDRSLWTLTTGVVYKKIVLASDIALSDVLTIRAFAAQPVNNNGYYEIPINLQNNPLNNAMNDFTLGEVIDHVNSIVDNHPTFSGSFPGSSDLRDLGDITPYGTKFVQHSGPAGLSLYHITSEANNIVKSIEKSRDDYGKFKRAFVSLIDNFEIQSTDPVAQVTLLLQELAKDKPKTSPYYFSDMVACTAFIYNEYPVIDYRIKTYPLSAVFNLDALSNKAVHVYLNKVHLIYGKDYTFSNQGFAVISDSVVMHNDDTIEIYEYDSTDGCFVPATPTKLGLWPKFEPKIYTDYSLITPRKMIQGHDGSQVLAYGDYRDDLVLELEKRIFNNIKVKYDSSIFDIYDFLPSYVRTTDYSLTEFNEVLAPQFFKWTGLINKDFSKSLGYDVNNPLTYNFRDYTAPDGREVPGYWRGIFRWMFDTDRPNIAPWEMLGFTQEPAWWQEQYGPAPYTSDNLPMWEDLSNGLVKEPGQPPVRLDKFVRPFLLKCIPVNEVGEIIDPINANLVSGINTGFTYGDFVFGDVGPIEATWRRSSHYPFSFIITAMLLSPAKTFGVLLDRSRIVRNLTGQLIYKDTGLRIRPQDLTLPSIYSSDARVQTSGIINYIADYILSDNLKSYTEYKYNLENVTCQLSYRLGAFTSKQKFNLLLDSKSPTSTGGVFVPQEDYDIILNISSPVKKITYSGIIITKVAEGFEVKGYSKTNPYFKYYPWLQSGQTINVGGISESYSIWAPQERYAVGKIVKYDNKFYRSKVQQTSTSSFDSTMFEGLTGLPVIGGREAIMRKLWDRSSPIAIPYGTTFRTIQETVDFIVGYGEFLKDEGFEFDTFNNDLALVTNWESSAKEFLFWTTQNWSSGQDKWQDWLPNTDYPYQSIVRYFGDYYQAKYKSFASPFFPEADFEKLDGLSTVGSSVISLSPSALNINFLVPYAVVDDIRSQFNGYEIFKVDGAPLPPNFINSYRENNATSYAPASGDGLFGASFYLVQKEQVVILKNTTMFNDTIYNPESGYRQERISVSGYVSTGWYGAFDAPGFIFDQAKITDWTPWTDYALGDIVKYKEFYYGAESFISGKENFVPADWVKLKNKPTPGLLPNWTYKATQFTDFYSLDSDNFDIGQQNMAQHLVGYQKRQYLENIIKDDVSEFKFYQGMIIEKGTQNVLNKLFDVLSADGIESLKFYEEWAVRVGQYGASAAFENIEFTLDESLFKNNPQGIELVNESVKDNLSDFVIRQTPNDVYLKPLGYNNAPWPLLDSYTPYLRTPGHVRPDEVSVILKTIDEITTKDISTFSNGDYVWVGFKGREWNVYRYSPATFTVTDVTYDSGAKELTIETDQLIALESGTYIGIEKLSFAGFYKIKSVVLNKIIVSATIAGWQPFTAGTLVPTFVLTTQRSTSIDGADSVIFRSPRAKELLWTGGPGTGEDWATWIYDPVYSSSEITNGSPSNGLEFGKTVSLNKEGTIAAISAINGSVKTYAKFSDTLTWVLKQNINKPFISHGESTWLPNTSYAASDLVFYVNAYYLASQAVDSNSGYPLPSASTLYWRKTYFANVSAISDVSTWLAIASPLASKVSTTPTAHHITPVGTAGINSSYTEQGVVSVYKKDANNIYNLVVTFVSPSPASYEHFGSNLIFAGDTLFVSAIGTGKVYQIDYKTRSYASAIYVPSGSSGSVVKLTSIAGIELGMFISGNGFTQNQFVTAIDSETSSVTLNIAPDGQVSGRLTFTITSWGYYDSIGLSEGLLSEQFGYELAVSKDTSTLLVSAPDIGGTTAGKVYVYKNNTDASGNLTNVFELSQSPITHNSDVEFGRSITVSDTGEYIAISSTLADQPELRDCGAVYVYKTDGTAYSKIQELTNVIPENFGSFGSKIAFMNDYKTLVVYSSNADTEVETSFDNSTTTFDDSLTRYITKHINSGRIDIYDRYAAEWIFSESLATSNVTLDGYGSSVTVGNNHVFVGAPYADDNGFKSGRIYEYSKLTGNYSWTVLHKEVKKPDINKIKTAFLYNKDTNELVTYLDVIDSVQGKIPGIAEQELKYKTFYDPAIYNDPTDLTSIASKTVSVGNDIVNVDNGLAWGKAQVGMLWWDLRTAKFIESHTEDLVYRNSTWNTLFPGASIDIYEWVESSLLPSDWAIEADTDAGLTLGISGQPLYGDTVYSVSRRYDNVSRTYRNTYYYWVKNKTVIPNVVNRHMSANDVSSLISNPRGQNYKYLAVTSANSFSLVNVKENLQASNVVLSVQYWTSDNQDQNIHRQWKIISNDKNTELPTAIEKKWIDSLCGKDDAGRLVPDPNLPPKLKYGVENRPRQGMFVNRFEALKQLFESVNALLKTIHVVNEHDISKLNDYEAEPNANLGAYDIVFDTDAELRFANVGNFKKPVLTPVITNGTIVGVTIVSRGFGYVNAPFIDIAGDGTGAKIKTIINVKGQVTGVNIISGGKGYNSSNTTLSTRTYAALVHSDTQALNTWSIYAYDTNLLTWSRLRSQSYDTRRYWSYVDWYATGYNQYTSADFLVNTLVDLNTVAVKIGQTVKVKTTNAGGWQILEKYADSPSIDWTQSYHVVAGESGTIQFDSSLYSFTNTSYGFDGALYDGNIFDNSATTELKNILNCLKNNILIDDLKQNYLDLFFVCVRYAHSEQNYLDWIFKTSFVKSQHNVGELKQLVTYKNDNLADFESYISEVKPYRTKVREYISNYSKVDNSELSVTDFDLPPIYEDYAMSVIETNVTNEAVDVSTHSITTYPWKHWLDNLGFTVTELKLIDGGSNYHSEPTVRFVGKSGSGASARALIANGKVNRIILLSKGSGYLKAPIISIEGGLKADGVPAKAVAIIGNSVIRSNMIKMKFDRTTQNYHITKLEETETFTGTNSRLQWPLTWAPDVRVGKTTVTVNGVSVLRDDYKLSIVKSTSRGYTSYSGSIIFKTAPVLNSVISVTYLKDWSLLNAADRIQYYYNPTAGELGKDLAQLMTGVDYGGVNINGLGFGVSEGWDTLPYFTDRWDSFDSSAFDDYITSVGHTNTHVFTLPYITNVEINAYHIKQAVSNTPAVLNQLDYSFDPLVDSPVVSIVSTAVATGSTAGQYILDLDNTSLINVGDVVTTSVSGILSYNTIVTEIIDGVSIKLDQILFSDVVEDTHTHQFPTFTFTNVLSRSIDYKASVVGIITLTTPADVGTFVNITGKLNSVRIPQDLVTRTSTNTGTNTSVYTIDNSVDLVENDIVILRKVTSDGSVAPLDQDYDTALSGGDMSYESATGLLAEDIVVDGDGFVTPTTSAAPEEVVPGHVFDAVAIKVFDRPTAGSASIRVDNFISNGTTRDFVLTQQPNTKQAIIVKTGTAEVSTVLTSNVDYTFDYQTNTLSLENALPQGKLISVFNFGFSGSNILDLDYFVGNGDTKEFITKAPWLNSITGVVYKNGEVANISFFETDETYDSNKRVGIRFTTAPAAGEIINFVIVSGSEQTFAVTSTEKFIGDSSNLTNTYDLSNIVGDSLPIESNMIVRVDQTILNAPNNNYFTIKANKYTYELDKNKYLPFSVDVGSIAVFADGTPLQLGSDFIIDQSVISVKITKSVASEYKGTTLTISVAQDSGYIYIPGTASYTTPDPMNPAMVMTVPAVPGKIRFINSYTSSNTIEVISSYKHDVLDIERTAITVTPSVTFTPDSIEYYTHNEIFAGTVQLDRQVINEDYVWVIKNGTLLTPKFDYRLSQDRSRIVLLDTVVAEDVISIITFGSNILQSGISYMQFKDMLNRTHFKRLSLNKQTKLATDLHISDTSLTVLDASNFDIPNPELNKPGIIEIRGERIEFFKMEGNTLSQLRRGTLGTGVSTLCKAGSIVQEIGTSETIPYSDQPIVDQIVSDTSTSIPLKFIPKNVNEIEVFVGGYNTDNQWASSVEYAVGMIVTVGSYTFRCKTLHTSSTSFYNDYDPQSTSTSKWELFVGNIRLKKEAYKLHNVNKHPESPEGDIEFPADFTVDGISRELQLTTPLNYGTFVTVVRKQGIDWDGKVTASALTADDKVASFLKSSPGVWYTDMNPKD